MLCRGETGRMSCELWRKDDERAPMQQKAPRRTLMHETSFQEAKVGAMDANAFAERYSAIYRDLYRYALCMMVSAADAEDAVGEAVVSAFRARDGLRGDQSFRPWMFQILTNECRRRLKRRSALAETEMVDSVGNGPALDGEDAILVREAMATLSEEDRCVVSLAVVGGYSSAEIGIMLTMSPSSVRSRKKRSLAKLAALLKDVNA